MLVVVLDLHDHISEGVVVVVGVVGVLFGFLVLLLFELVLRESEECVVLILFGFLFLVEPILDVMGHFDF